MALSYVKFHSAIEKIIELAANFGSDTIKVALSNTAPVAATDDEFADITEIAGGNGYTAGGATLTISSATQSSGTYTVAVGADVVWTASGGDIGPFRYIIMYDDTLAGDPLIGYWDYGSSITVTNGNSLTLNTNGTNIISAS